MSTKHSLERGGAGKEQLPTVTQPKHFEAFQALSAIVEEIDRISEKSASGPGEQWSGAQSTGKAITDEGKPVTLPSPREQAIASLPPPAIMQRELAKHIRTEVHHLRKEAHRIVKIGRPGAAHKLSLIYAKIRRLNALWHEIIEASYEVLKRLFIRVFVDRQSIM